MSYYEDVDDLDVPAVATTGYVGPIDTLIELNRFVDKPSGKRGQEMAERYSALATSLGLDLRKYADLTAYYELILCAGRLPART